MRRLLDTIRRQLEERFDQLGAVLKWQFTRAGPVPRIDNGIRIALVTANYSTTRWLSLMLLTLSKQSALSCVSEIVVVDNDSRDGGPAMLDELSALDARVIHVPNRWRLNHARAIRLGIRTLDRINSRANVILAIDTDVAFLRNDCLHELMDIFKSGCALAGEMRHGGHGMPHAQASFLAFRRDVCHRWGILPWVNHGSPSYWMQRSIRRAGLPVFDFRSYEEAYALHRGRAGVLASKDHYPLSSYASVENNQPHFMGVQGGAELWQSIERQWSASLAENDPKNLARCINRALNAHD
jgi:glycosyltransferase involved in cell wall biosynthesis